MINRLVEYDPELDYWAVYPDALLDSTIKELYDKDTSKKKSKSSKIMLAIHYCLHPNSAIYNYPKKWDEVKKSLVKDEKLDWTDYKEIIFKYKEMVLTQAERSLLEWEEFMQKRDNFLKSRIFVVGDFEANRELEMMSAKNASYYKEYFQIKEALMRERENQKGDQGEVSLWDTKAE